MCRWVAGLLLVPCVVVFQLQFEFQRVCCRWVMCCCVFRVRGVWVCVCVRGVRVVKNTVFVVRWPSVGTLKTSWWVRSKRFLKTVKTFAYTAHAGAFLHPRGRGRAPQRHAQLLHTATRPHDTTHPTSCFGNQFALAVTVLAQGEFFYAVTVLAPERINSFCSYSFDPGGNIFHDLQFLRAFL